MKGEVDSLQSKLRSADHGCASVCSSGFHVFTHLRGHKVKLSLDVLSVSKIAFQ